MREIDRANAWKWKRRNQEKVEPERERKREILTKVSKVRIAWRGSEIRKV